MSYCPKCKSQELRHSQARSRWERWRKEITGKHPYRCRVWRWRGWRRMGFGEAAAFSSRTQAPEPPNLRGTALARPETRAAIDLRELDRFHAIHDKDRS